MDAKTLLEIMRWLNNSYSNNERENHVLERKQVGDCREKHGGEVTECGEAPAEEK
jgi:hypothetical protein